MPRRHRITALHFTDHTVSMRVDGEPVWDRFHVNSRVPYVGHYDLKKPVLRVDAKITDPRQRKSLLVHEAVERNDRVHHNLEAHPAHAIAQATEHHVALHHLGMSRHAWTRYNDEDVERVFRLNRREGERRRR